MTTSHPYLILKYYYYVPIPDPIALREAHHLYCIQRGLRGRIKIAREGINGTLSGRVKDCQAYMRHLHAHPLFRGIEFNSTPSATQVHNKLHVRLKEEIVRGDLNAPIDERDHQPNKDYITPTTFHNRCQDHNTVLLDVRSNHEHALGTFHNAITFDIDNFRAFFQHAKTHAFDTTKTYIVICTRGIKSVKAWHYLKHTRQLPHVYYLRGGILDYGQQTDGSRFQGSCYVFDKRLVVPINKTNPTTISQCHACQQPCQRMINCANNTCNAHLPMCPTCTEQRQGACSTTCAQHPEKRTYNGIGYYMKQPHGYNPYIGARRNIQATS